MLQETFPSNGVVTYLQKISVARKASYFFLSFTISENKYQTMRISSVNWVNLIMVFEDLIQ